MLALVVAFTGGAATLALDQHWLQSWAGSGVGFPICQRRSVELPAGVSHVWYESRHSLPVSEAGLFLVDDSGVMVLTQPPATYESYKLLFGEQSGRALCRLNLAKSGVYQFTCINNHFDSEDEIPPDDRVVFLKTPDTLAEAGFVRKLIQVTGATATATGVIVLYLLHAVALRKRRKNG